MQYSDLITLLQKFDMKKATTIIALICLVGITHLVFPTFQTEKVSATKSSSLEVQSPNKIRHDRSSGAKGKTRKLTKSGARHFAELHQRLRTGAGQKSPGYRGAYHYSEFAKAKKRGLKRSTVDLDWIERGPGNVSGRTRGLLVDPRDTSSLTWIAGSIGGGIWRTTNGGQNWENLTPDIPYLSISTLAMSGSDQPVFYAGTGESFGGLIGNGILKSVDDGKTWETLQSTIDDPRFKYINRLIVDPADPNHLVVCSQNNNTPFVVQDSVPSSFIMKSTDGGNSWTETYSSLNSIQHIINSPQNFNLQFAALNSKGIIKSVDGGVTWLPSLEALQNHNRIEIAIAPSDSNFIYASIEQKSGGIDIFRTRDGGTSWKRMAPINKQNQDLGHFFGQGWYDNTLAVHPYDPETVFLAGVPSIISVSEVDTSYSKPDVRRLVKEVWGFLDISPTVGSSIDAENFPNLEIRFGPGKKQKAHFYRVYDEINYSGYHDVPF